MTAPKSLQRKEVERVTAALRGALKEECPDYEEPFLDFPPAGPAPRSKRGAALWEAYRLSWSASARFTRREQRGLAAKRGGGEAFFDDRQVGAAIASLERARTLARKASAALEKDISRIRRERAKFGLRGDDLDNHPEHVSAIREIVDALDRWVSELKTFQGIPQARTQSEWDEFVSRTAKKLLAAGFGTREVAGLLTGKKPEAVERATLERFRQRVNRLASSKS